ncbi:TPA: thioesterase family protein [Escherichia coli]|uniref:thioesterase family protein n=1 Tax=Pseudomonadota TaxID=1224 RepID=UPI00287D85C7|nr:thioesterase family protein [Escherichia coli]HEA1244450.1 thioesterase family protein [Escherichia coli]HEA1932972.1 thioesterase family protein [Escherichia coli]HEA2340393.1 thioesterase family protein [Escherichia coli]
MTFDFDDLMCALLPNADGRGRVNPGEGWRQGRTLYGGLTAAIAVRSAEAAGVSPHPLRSAQFAFTGVAGESVESCVQPLASGRSSDFVQVLCSSDDRIVLTALLCFGAHRDTASTYSSIPEHAREVPAPVDCPAYFNRPEVPHFTRQFEARLAQGAQLASGAQRPDLSLWLRHRSADAADTASSIIALADALPPATMLTESALIRVSSMTWHVDILCETFRGAGWHLARSVAEHTGAGYSSQDMSMWSEDGSPVLRARQTIAVYP